VLLTACEPNFLDERPDLIRLSEVSRHTQEAASAISFSLDAPLALAPVCFLTLLPEKLLHLSPMLARLGKRAFGAAPELNLTIGDRLNHNLREVALQLVCCLVGPDPIGGELELKGVNSTLPCPIAVVAILLGAWVVQHKANPLAANVDACGPRRLITEPAFVTGLGERQEQTVEEP
jgi:hypothetical protein